MAYRVQWAVGFMLFAGSLLDFHMFKLKSPGRTQCNVFGLARRVSGRVGE